jgi:predicted regulator of Ras-like GTPase activity (Roadblock/LC7/MglB family)
MKCFTLIAKLPEITGAVLSDSSGALLESSGSADGEAAGAVHVFSLHGLNRAGEMLGLGGIGHASVVGPSMTCVMFLHGDEILGVYVDPSKPLSAVEKKLHELLQRP